MTAWLVLSLGVLAAAVDGVRERRTETRGAG